MKKIVIFFCILFHLFCFCEFIKTPPVDPFDDKDSDEDGGGDSPFDEIVTRAPQTIQERQQMIQKKAEEQLNMPLAPRPLTPRRRVVYRYEDGTPAGYYRPAVGGALYNIYPILYPKGPDYCPQLRGIFRFTCQPSKPLRLDLVEFCKQYASFCGVLNTHRLPGPGLGPPPDPRSIGHVGVSGNFGFGIGAVPGLEVNAGWGVDVGPIPGMGDSVDVGINTGLSLLGASPPLKYRRGMDNPSDARGGLVGINGGVGVSAPGTGPIGVGTGLGIG